ncbi:MAG: hypothetical protein NZM40_06175 [Sphingomonadaceae bacterium]|uniref:hypothetical protein n=1 Tax=Thermaurantiacus sp. TaxID=2820283 RepID=UPI00298EDF36|nr:hypothetical protein [Thermaurantiacus sp.]MCS6987006.1 hypothetical protein [Sphingomonadaceae bacterium]MDW8415656.1 hypothetical protein [Thermaurantiacus sp.]
MLVAEAKTPAGLVRLGLDRPTAALALERIFGAPDLIPPEPPERLADLVPASASWETLTTLLAEAMAPALAEAGLPPTEPPVPASRLGPLDLAGPVESQGFALELGGRPGHLALTLAPAAPAGRAATADGPATAAPEPQHGPPASDPWQARIARLARQIELPIGLRIAELRLPVETVARLEVGSLIPIARPRLLMLSVDGVPWRRVAHPHDTGSGGAQP